MGVFMVRGENVVLIGEMVILSYLFTKGVTWSGSWDTRSNGLETGKIPFPSSSSKFQARDSRQKDIRGDQGKDSHRTVWILDRYH